MMTKQIVISSQEEIEKYIEYLQLSANKAKIKIDESSNSSNPLGLLEKIKYEKIGFDPLNSNRPLNLIEQINQTFTYLASFKAAEYLFKKHEGLNELVLNLGTKSGSDIESKFEDGIAGEVFSSVTPSNNDKLRKDIMKVAETKAFFKYVFFLCPNIDKGVIKNPFQNDVVVYSLGKD